jgi:hypothetical protein
MHFILHILEVYQSVSAIPCVHIKRVTNFPILLAIAIGLIVMVCRLVTVIFFHRVTSPRIDVACAHQSPLRDTT